MQEDEQRKDDAEILRNALGCAVNLPWYKKIRKIARAFYDTALECSAVASRDVYPIARIAG